MTRLNPLWIAVAAFVLAFLLYLAWIATHDKVWYDRPLPIEGEATYNDFYVVQEALRAQGVRVASMPHLQGTESWSGRDSLLLGSDPKTLGPEQATALLSWVGRGGRLLVATQMQAADEGVGVPLFDRIGVSPSEEYSCFKLPGNEKAQKVSCFVSFVFRSGERGNFQVAIGNQAKGWILARRSWGRGEIEVLGSLDSLRMNTDQHFLPHALHDDGTRSDWEWQVLAPVLPQGGVFHIVYQSDLPPLYVYLVQYGWYALLPLLFALLAWLWASSQRFGPAMPLPAADRRALGEHIVASGEFLYRRGLLDALYAPLRRRFDDRLRRRDPELAALPADEIVRTLAQRHRLPAEAVRQAMQPPLPKQRKAFLATVQTLLQLIRNP